MKTINLGLILALAFTVGLMACGDGSSGKTASGSPAADSLFNEVLELHDALMADMGTISSLTEKLQKKLDSGSLSDDIATHVKNSKIALEKADDAMHKWMKNFDTDKKADVKYLKEQLSQIKDVENAMNNAIADAKAIFK